MIPNYLLSCIMATSLYYGVPPAALVGIYGVEGGSQGIAVRNTNGSYDLGYMQINTIHAPEMAEIWGISEEEAIESIRHDACTNVEVAGFLLARHMKDADHIYDAIGRYHSKTPKYKKIYIDKVISFMERNNLVEK